MGATRADKLPGWQRVKQTRLDPDRELRLTIVDGYSHDVWQVWRSEPPRTAGCRHHQQQPQAGMRIGAEGPAERQARAGDGGDVPDCPGVVAGLSRVLGALISGVRAGAAAWGCRAGFAVLGSGQESSSAAMMSNDGWSTC